MFRNLKQKAADGDMYRKSLINDLKTFSAVSFPEITAATLERIAENLSVDQLNELINAFEKKAADILPMKPQLFSGISKNTNSNNNIYKNI